MVAPLSSMKNENSCAGRKPGMKPMIDENRRSVNSQLDEFTEAAGELETDDPESFEKRLKKLVEKGE